MTAEARTVILTKESATARAVASAIEGQEHLAAGGVFRDLVSLMTSLEREAAPVVIVDVGAEPMNTLDALEPVINRYVQSRFVVLAEEPSAEVVLRAMQIGVRHVQRKSTLGRELPPILQRLARSANQQAKQMGCMYTVLSAGGGCGSTTLAVNLAYELQLAGQESALLVDLDYAYGAIATYLDLHGQYGVADVFRHTGTIDSHLVRTTAVHAAEKLYALLSPASINLADAGPIPLEPLEQIIPAFKHGFGHTIVDAPRVSIEIADALARASEVTYIVLQPAVKDVRHAKTLMTLLASRGVPAERLRPIMNRYRKRRQMISVADAQKALGNYPLECLTNDYASAIRGVNYGKPLAEAAPRSTLRRELTQLAGDTAGLSNGRHRG